MSDMEMQCQECRFFNEGHCHRYPPEVAEVGMPGRAKWVQHLPVVNPDNYCGEFKPKGKMV